MITFTSEEFLKVTGNDLNYILPDKDDNSNKVDRAINKACTYVYLTLGSYQKIVDDDLSDLQNANIKLACIWQLDYTIENGDYTNYNAFDEETNQILDTKLLKEIALSPISREYLRQCGLVNRNITRRKDYFIDGWWY